MKKIFLSIALVAIAFVQNTFAQAAPTSPEVIAQQTQLSLLLISYYDIKDALVASKASTASVNAADFVKHLNEIDSKTIPQANSNALLKEATKISEAKDLKHQREHFDNFSENMFELAKTVKLTSDLVYQAYCPMKKASWLSNSKAIKNPYYGNVMLTCGSITETLQ
ncbi:MAG: DUF3347 domain-containing protein [Ferruginibacter sp.]